MLNLSCRLNSLFFTRNLRPKRLEQLFSTAAEAPDLVDPKADSESILNSVKDIKKVKNYVACNSVISLAKLSIDESQMKNLKDDKRFKNLIKLLETDVRTCNPLAIISCLKAFKILKIDDESLAVKNLENAFLWLARTCPIKELVMGFSFSLNRQETESQKIMFREICTALERRWVEIKDGRLFVLLFSHWNKLSPEFLAKLEDRIQDCIEDMSAADLVNILVTFGRSGRRNMPVLRSLGFHIAKNRSFLDIKQIADVLFAFNKLSFKEQDTLERICSSLEPLIDTNDNLAVVRSILTSLGQLRFSPSNVLDMICEWYNSRYLSEKPVELKDISTLIITLANLNYIPFGKEDFFKRAIDSVKKEDMLALPRGDQLWIDFVWSLVVLGKATPDHLSSVLETNFSSKFLESDEHKVSSIKLLNVNGAAQSLYKDYTGPTIDIASNAHLAELSSPASGAKLKLKKFVFDSLSTLFPPPRFVNEDVRTGMGTSIDAEVVVDANVKPLQVDQYCTKIGSTKQPKELPIGAHKIAIFITPFQDSLIGGGETGTTSLMVKLARAQGYTTLVIDHGTIDSSMKVVSRVQKLDVLIKQAVGKRS